MREIPFWQRLGTRLTLLILGVVAVLALATGILLVRSFELVVQDAVAAAGGAEPEIGDVVRATVINLIAIFLFTLVGAAVFSRTLLTEPIAQLVRGTRELAAGRLGTTLPVTSRSELGRLALLEVLLSRLEAAAAIRGAAVLGPTPGGGLEPLAIRGAPLSPGAAT